MKKSEDNVKTRINAIEKRIVELKFIERDIIRERNMLRFPLLEMAERCDTVKELINSFFIKTMKFNLKDISVTAYPSKYSGRNEEEFLSEIKVEMRYRPEPAEKYNELALTVFLRDGFEDEKIRSKESGMMDRLFETESEVKKLRAEKKGLNGA